jgi:hypothetical protein
MGRGRIVSDVIIHVKFVCVEKFVSDVGVLTGYPSSHEGNEVCETLDHKLTPFFHSTRFTIDVQSSRSSFGIHSPVRILSGSPFTTMFILSTGFFIAINPVADTIPAHVDAMIVHSSPVRSSSFCPTQYQP